MTGNNVEHTDDGDTKRYDALPAAAWIPEMVDRIVEEFDPLQIILFGSHARGDANHWSDIDLLVVFEELNEKLEMTLAIRRVLQDCGAPKDIVVTDMQDISQRGTIPGSVLAPALREGKMLYERL